MLSSGAIRKVKRFKASAGGEKPIMPELFAVCLPCWAGTRWKFELVTFDINKDI
jgi:hypothetical protein